MRKIHRTGILGVMVLILTIFGLFACSAKKPSPTGFLSDYSKLKPSPFKDAKGAMVYFNPDLHLMNYTRFIVNPVQVRLAPEGVERGIEREKLEELADYFHERIVYELTTSDYEVVEDPGPETLLIRIAITDVKPAKRGLNILPQAMISGVGLGTASGEAELIDALTGEVVVAATDTQKGYRGFDAWTKYGNAENVLDLWALRLVIRLDEANGRTRPNI